MYKLLLAGVSMACLTACPSGQQRTLTDETLISNDTAAIAARGGQVPPWPLQWSFQPTQAERQQVNARIASLVERHGALGMVGGGTVYRLPGNEGDRFLLVTFRGGPPDGSGGRGNVILVNLTGEDDPAIFNTGIPDVDAFAIRGIQDVDKDGQADVVACVWDPASPEDTDEGGRRVVYGFRDARWYHVEEGVPGTC